ncbi:MAG TPA: S8 family serine peptidase, partial [Candidatus Deferrimicrobium sp.]|nr:S8 family serine peptidase [Candidatus Deferrimicrobium sp.]
MKKNKMSLIFIFLFICSFYLPVFTISFLQFRDSDSITLKDVLFNPPKFETSKINDWGKIAFKADKNHNGFNDQFEQKLIVFSEPTISGTKLSENLEKFTNNSIPIIIFFPEGDYSSISFLFENMGGNIKETYKSAINGFAGVINYNQLKQFSDVLLHEKVPFIIEEDCELNTTLYYASRNMNLRPYVWNTLGYTGDEYSSIAIIDSGIDNSHPFFSPGYSDGNFSYKIVGWKDEVNNLSTPYDDSGHGSHCAGILSSEGSPLLDGYGRTVSTYSYKYDHTGEFIPDQMINLTAANFNVTEEGTVDIYCEFNDYTSGSGHVYLWAYLYHDETLVDSHVLLSSAWNYTLSYNVTNSTLGDYSLKIILNLDSVGGFVGSPHIRFRSEIHWPFNPPLLGCGDPWKGVASDTHLVGVKVVDSNGICESSELLAGINWIITNKEKYNITTVSMSLVGPEGQTSIINAVNNIVENGIVAVVAAGNDGGIGNNIGSPADADNVITVAAMSDSDHITDYSSSGGFSFTENTIKPDITAPGGSFFNFSIFSTDTNENDAAGEYSDDLFANDLFPAVGTSMATPMVAGAANLLIQAMNKYQNWGYTAIEAKRVKALLLMTATETFPLEREEDSSYSPELNRGGKDIHEGFGRLNIDTALEAYTQQLSLGVNKSAWLSSSLVNPFNKHALGGYVDLISGENYNFHLQVPEGADFDLYLYSNTPTPIGEPIMVASSTSDIVCNDELINYTPIESGRYYLIAKAISGEGYANISYRPNNFMPVLTNKSVSPPAGNQTTLLNFSIIYTDLDDSPPISINVLINGTIYPMEKRDLFDKKYDDGCFYQYLIYLQPGMYNYSFECYDGKFSNATTTYFGLNVTEIPNINTPVLNDGKVYPEKGYHNSTIFIFSVNYTDDDNNAPNNLTITINSTIYSMIKQDGLDTNYMDGCSYVFNTVLDVIGNYTYCFNCSDGTYASSLGYYIGPSVEENRLINYTMFADYDYAWVDATSGIQCDMDGQDDAAELFYLPFIFRFYNESFSHIYVS